MPPSLDLALTPSVPARRPTRTLLVFFCFFFCHVRTRVRLPLDTDRFCSLSWYDRQLVENSRTDGGGDEGAPEGGQEEEEGGEGEEGEEGLAGSGAGGVARTSSLSPPLGFGARARPADASVMATLKARGDLGWWCRQVYFPCFEARTFGASAAGLLRDRRPRAACLFVQWPKECVRRPLSSRYVFCCPPPPTSLPVGRVFWFPLSLPPQAKALDSFCSSLLRPPSCPLVHP